MLCSNMIIWIESSIMFWSFCCRYHWLFAGVTDLAWKLLKLFIKYCPATIAMQDDGNLRGDYNILETIFDATCNGPRTTEISRWHHGFIELQISCQDQSGSGFDLCSNHLLNPFLFHLQSSMYIPCYQHSVFVVFFFLLFTHGLFFSCKDIMNMFKINRS